MSKRVAAPQLLELTIENTTQNIKLLNSQASDPRFKYLMEKLVDHLHEYVRETRLTPEEWTKTIEFLATCGHMCTDTRQEFALLSDVLGVGILVEAINHPKPPNATESSVLGPMYEEKQHNFANGDNIASPGKGEMCLVLATVKDTKGNPIEGAKINVWETDGTGRYDSEYAEREGPDMRGCLTSDKNGDVYFKCVRPAPYSIPTDGPVGRLLEKLNRPPYRPAHIHFHINVPNSKYDDLVTALYVRDDPYVFTDAIFGVKKNLIVDFAKVGDASIAKKYGVDEQDWLVKYDFVLTTRDETQALLKKSAQD